jgi:hypothetical protein
MKVTLLDPADLPTLRERVRSEADAKQRDRLRAVLLAAEGEDGRELEGNDIAKRLGRSPRFVDLWLARYRGGGLAAVRPGKAKGQKPKLPVEKQAAFKARLLAGPAEADAGVCTPPRHRGQADLVPGSSAWRWASAASTNSCTA